MKKNAIPRLLLPHSLLIALLWVACAIGAAGQVQVQLQQPPRNQLKVADLWKITITNTTPDQYQIFLRGTATHQKDGKIADAHSATFTLPPNTTKMVSGVDISPVKLDSSDPEYKAIFTQTGTVPAGNYTICVYVTAVARNGNQLPAPEVIGSDCKTAEVHPQSPPVLIFPEDESDVTETQPQFTWLPPAPLPPGQKPRYQLRIVEILGRQTSYDAMRSNPAWFTTTLAGIATLRYPLASRRFIEGRRYAWQITAFGEGYQIGESEVWWFRYNPNKGANSSDGSDYPILPGGGISQQGQEGGGIGGTKPIGSAGSVVPGFGFVQLEFPFLKNYHDHNARLFRPNTPNETVADASGCGTRPSITISDSIEASAPDGSGVRVRLRWQMRHSAPIDHIDLRISAITRSGTDSLVRQFIYRQRENGTIAGGTTFSPAEIAGAEVVTFAVSGVAVDMLGRSSRIMRHQVSLAIAGYTRPTRHLIGSEEYALEPFGQSESATDTIVVRSISRDGRTATGFSTNRLSLSRRSRTVTMVNNDVIPHHFTSVFTPTYAEFAPPIGIGGIPRLNFGLLSPGQTVTIALPDPLPQCYQWTLFDQHAPAPNQPLRIVVDRP
ncbi:MAG: hypothetical protein DYG96_04075 [Chlorobi bacterium CHB2]|nr:hypothetical protein [Chlorobi bacterium CHB2]